MDVDGTRYSCWGHTLWSATLIPVMLVFVAVAGIAGRNDGSGQAPLALLVAVWLGLAGLEVMYLWWLGCDARVEGEYLAWRALTRRRWIRLDRIESVTIGLWPNLWTMTFRTDDGGRLRLWRPVWHHARRAQAFAATVTALAEAERARARGAPDPA